MEPRQSRARNACAEARPDQVVERTEAERPGSDLRESVGKRLPEPKCVAGVPALGGDDSDRLVREPPGGIRDRPLRGRIEPMRIVDRDENRPATCEHAEIREERARQGRAVGPPADGASTPIALASSRRCGSNNSSATSWKAESSRSATAPSASGISTSTHRVTRPSPRPAPPLRSRRARAPTSRSRRPRG